MLRDEAHTRSPSERPGRAHPHVCLDIIPAHAAGATRGVDSPRSLPEQLGQHFLLEGLLLCRALGWPPQPSPQAGAVRGQRNLTETGTVSARAHP